MIVYLIRNKDNFKCYVGKTKFSLLSRWKQHLLSVDKESKYHLHRAIRKDGQEIFEKEILNVVATKEEMNQLETLWIITLRTFDPDYGYNMTFGGEGGEFTDEVKRRIGENSRKHLLGTKHPEAGRKLAETWRIQGHPYSGKKLSEKRCEAIRTTRINFWKEKTGEERMQQGELMRAGRIKLKESK